MILDANIDYFETHDGYEYAKRFYAEAYQFAVKVYGEDNILSAVMHAHEINLALSDQYGGPIYHHIARGGEASVMDEAAQNPELVGTVKEIAHQVSHSKKWKSPQALDEQGKPMDDEKGKVVLVPTYSILQDEIFEHTQAAGFTDFARGERGSTAADLPKSAL